MWTQNSRLQPVFVSPEKSWFLKYKPSKCPSRPLPQFFCLCSQQPILITQTHYLQSYCVLHWDHWLFFWFNVKCKYNIHCLYLAWPPDFEAFQESSVVAVGFCCDDVGVWRGELSFSVVSHGVVPCPIFGVLDSSGLVNFPQFWNI